MSVQNVEGNIQDLGGFVSNVTSSNEKLSQYDVISQMIVKSLEETKTSIIESVSGDGVSFAQLIPTVSYAALKGKKVIISTHSIGLQQQMYNSYLPMIQNLLAPTGVKFSSAVLKGRNNYLCTKKLQQVIKENNPEDKEELEKFLSYATKDGKVIIGDKTYLPYQPSNKFWNKIVSKQVSCSKETCPDNMCFYQFAKKRINESDIVIVNHHLLVADIISRKNSNKGILPDYDAVVVNEAHFLEEVATDLMTTRVSYKEVKNLLYRVKGALNDSDKNLLSLCNRIEEETHSIFDEVKNKMNQSKYVKNFLESNLNGDFALLNELADKLKNNTSSDFSSLSRRAEKLYNDFSLINKLEQEEVCNWSQIEFKEPVLMSTPLEVGATLREGLFNKVPVVLTSNSIKFEKDLSIFAKRIGQLTEGDYFSAFSTQTNQEQSHFCFYVPENALDVPKASDKEKKEAYDQYCREEMVALAQMNKGHAFFSFGNFYTMREFYDKLSRNLEQLGYVTVKQGDIDTSQVLELLQNNNQVVIFGVGNYLEGLASPLNGLSLVVEHKLPFEVPTPVSQAKQVSIKKTGGDPFLENYVFDAVVKFKRNFNRLLQGSRKKGVYCVLDGRILSKKDSYGKYFLMSLPNTHKSVVKEELQPFFN